MITSFTDRYFFLSNFYPSIVYMDGLDYPTVEHAFQAAKSLVSNERNAVRAAISPALAKKMGRKLSLRQDWGSQRICIMKTLVTDKFNRHNLLQKLLLSTGTEELVEGNTWNDKFWGCVYYDGAWNGENHLGLILMEVRKELKKQKF